MNIVPFFGLDLFVLVLFGTVVLNALDLFFTDKLLDKLGPGAESNIVAQWVYIVWGRSGVFWFKLFFVSLFCGVWFFVWWVGNVYWWMEVLNVMVLGLFAWVVGRGMALWGVVK